MKYTLKGNYFASDFHKPLTTGPSAVDIMIDRHCPADTDLLLWSMPVEYRHVDPVVESAEKGFLTWRKTPINERISALKRFQEIALARKEEIAMAIALEMGKPFWEAMTEATSVVGKVDVTINDSLPRIQTPSITNIMPRTTGHTVHKPLGPCLIIGPFNFPCHLANTQILSALIAGNSIVFKPSEKTAYSGQLLIECLHQAGFPDGVINMIQGDGEIASRLVKEKRLKAVFFTGSKEVGLKILKSTHTDLSKMVALELGGKNPAIVHSDANLDLALTELLKGCFLTTGQRCTSTSIVAIHESILQQFVERFHTYAKKLVIGHPLENSPEPFMGPLVDQRAVDSYLLFMGMAKREGFEEIMRGKHLNRDKAGHYVSPSIHVAKGLDLKSHFLASEIFGPNCTFVPYKDFDEAIAIANSTEYGLASCLFSEDRSLYEQCLLEVDSGLLNYNRSTCGASAKLPFGGVKNSGNYRPAAVSTIDACVYTMTSLDVEHAQEDSDLKSIKGLDLT